MLGVMGSLERHGSAFTLLYDKVEWTKDRGPIRCPGALCQQGRLSIPMSNVEEVRQILRNWLPRITFRCTGIHTTPSQRCDPDSPFPGSFMQIY
jgi:hypothetical protein